MIVVTIPLLYGCCNMASLIWFSVILVLFMRWGRSPPIGINLFVIQASGPVS
jgi:TRAP-type C4-dicarboxylate transport system permease large subunit